MNALIEVQGLTKHYVPSRLWVLTGAKIIRAVQDVSFSIQQGSVFGLVGESGCGKTTIGRLILHLVEPTAGEVIFEGKNTLSYSEQELHEYRRKAQIVFQDPFGSFNPRRSILDSLSTGYEVFHLGDRRQQRKWLEEIMERVGLYPEYLDRYPHQFSGGQRQRLVIARALTLNPRFIVADEPVSALDVSIQAQILNLLRTLQRELKFTMLLISHDLRVIHHMCDQIGVMYAGRLVELATREGLFANPLHPYTKALINSAPSLDPAQGVPVGLIKGEVWDMVPPESGCAFYHRCSQAVAECESMPQALGQKGQAHAVACWRV
jgi:oligopeptide/dipeptide ABC transporter ATP-binding protein